MSQFLVINGPNLNVLGRREPEVYGQWSLEEIQRYTEEKLEKYEVSLEWFQSNSEGEIITKIQEAAEDQYQALIINPAAYSHTSVAILDALKYFPFPIIEVHLTNTHLRESFRQAKITAQAATAVIEGLGRESYYIAVRSQLNKTRENN